MGELYFFAKRFDEALAQNRRTHEVNPDFHYANVIRNIYILQERYDEAARDWLEHIIRSGTSKEQAQKDEWYRAYKKDGFKAWMKNEIQRYEKYDDVLLGVFQASVAYAQICNKEKSLEYLEKTYAGRALLLSFANACPEFDSLRDDAHFQDLMYRVGLR